MAMIPNTTTHYGPATKLLATFENQMREKKSRKKIFSFQSHSLCWLNKIIPRDEKGIRTSFLRRFQRGDKREIQRIQSSSLGFFLFTLRNN
jgi:hypothetical protein